MNANGLDRGAMTRSSTTSSDTVPWLTSITSCQVQAHRIPSTSLTSSTPSHEPHFMLPGVPSSTLTGLYRQSLTLPELSRHPYPAIYTTTGSAPYPSSSLYAAHGQPAGVPSLPPYGMYYHPYHHPGYSPGPSTGDMQSFSQLIARISQQAQPQLPRPYHPSHVSHQYPGQPLASPTGSPGPTAGPHPPAHPSPIQQLPHGALFREHPTPHKPETRRLSSRTSPLQSEKAIQRHSPLTHRTDHYSGLSSKELPPPSGTPKESRDPGVPAKSGADAGEYVRHMSGSLRRTAPGTPHDQQAMSGESYSGVQVKSEESPAKKPKLGPPPLHSQIPTTHTVTSSPSPSASMLPPPPPLQPATYTSQPHYPAHFMKGSIIQLANGELKRVEDLRTEDFVNSAEISPDLKIDSSTVVRIEKDEERGTAILGFSVGTQRIQVTVEATLEHPFYVFGRGWSSCSPERTSRRYGLTCCRLGIGDVCISLTQKESTASASAATATTTTTTTTSTTTVSLLRASSASPKHRPNSGRLPTAATTEHRKWTRTEREGRTTKTPDGSDTHTSHPLPLDTALPHAGSGFVPQGAVAHGDPRSATGLPGLAVVRKRRWSAPDHLHLDSRHEVTASPGPAARPGQQHQQHVQHQQRVHHQQHQQQVKQEKQHHQQQQSPSEADVQPLLLHQSKEQAAKQQQQQQQQQTKQQAKQPPKSSEGHGQT